MASGSSTEETIQRTLHREAGIDVSKAFFRNASPAILYEHALRYESNTYVSSSGALITSSGEKTGRSPKDKRIVKEPSSDADVWWGAVNMPMDERVFMINRERAVDYLNTRDRLYVVDGYAGWDKTYRIKVRVVCARAYHALFMQNMLIRPSAQELACDFGIGSTTATTTTTTTTTTASASQSAHPDFTIYNAGQFPVNRYTSGMSSKSSIAINFDKREMVILGTEYAGEMKKGVFTIMHYLMPKHHNVLSLHSSANESASDPADVSLFFGLSGTGKTTLSADPARRLIGDDEHCWSDAGVFNIEGGCYAKCIDLSRDKEPAIFDAIRYGAVLENVEFDPLTREVNYASRRITENSRCAYPIEFIPNAKVPCISTSHPKNIIMLTCDAFGVLPPVSRLTPEAAMYHFISGYTAKIPGTEQGVTEPTATFSACFGQPFLVLHPMRYARMLAEKMRQHGAAAWLVNTGWQGGPAVAASAQHAPQHMGSRIALAHSRLIIDAIHAGALAPDKVKFSRVPGINLDIPDSCPGVPAELLDPRKAWFKNSNGVDGGRYTDAATKLAERFMANFKTYSDDEAIVKAGPTKA